MATAPSPQRAYSAACPNCGAAVSFRSAASATAVCSYCRSTLVRDGEALRRIGQSAELFDDHSPLQLGSSGRWQGQPFTLVGRVQLRYPGGGWNEWHALFDGSGNDGAMRSGWLSEDNGRYVFTFDAPLPQPAPLLGGLQPGASLTIGGQRWQVASVTQVDAHAAEGELPRPPRLGGRLTAIDLRNAHGDVATLEHDADGPDGAPPRWSVGREAPLDELALQGLAEAQEKTLGARGAPCPSCGAPLSIKLETTQSVACGQCHAVVDVSQGLGADLAFYAQGTPGIDGGTPLLPLGQVGLLALDGGTPGGSAAWQQPPPGGSAAPAGAKPWQVVGYVERCTVPAAGDDERWFWREYLLYNRGAGFAFLVDADDGWSWVRPVTGAPEVRGRDALWQGRSHRETERYTGEITYVLGEFYWRLERGQRTVNVDYQGPGGARLNREQTAGAGIAEVVWSAGAALDADAVTAAFGLQRAAARPRDVQPLSNGGGGGSAASWIAIALLVLLVVVVIARCSRDECDAVRRAYGPASNEYAQCTRSAGHASGGYGGAFGGYSSGGGGHK